MSKPSSRFTLRYLHHHYRHIPSKPSPPTNPNASSTGISQLISHHSKLIPLTPWLSTSQSTHFTSSSISRIFQNPANQLIPQPNLLSNRSFLGFRYFAFKSSELGSKINGNFAKNAVKDPKTAVRDAFSRYREAVGLQIEAFWKRNSLLLVGAGGVMVCILLWRVMFGIANMFVGISEGLAKYGFLALSSAIVAFTGLYLRSRITINPDKVYRMAMRWLNTDAGILEVMGAPLSGTELRAYVMSGGGITLKNFKPGFRSKRCFLIFPIRGSERKGLVSVEVKNKKGQLHPLDPSFQSIMQDYLSFPSDVVKEIDEETFYSRVDNASSFDDEVEEYDMKLLAVDIPMATGPDQRIFLIGDEEEYRVGGGLISELRDPVVKAMAAIKEFEDRDEKEDEEDAERELQEAERRHQEEIEKLEKGS